MSCGGRIYKGDAITVSIPFNVEEYSALTVAYFTTGDYEVVREESELVIEDGYIIASFEGHDLDILPDGVLRYTIACVVDDEDYLYSTNTPLYLKTPKDYDAETAEEVYEEGYESGYTVGYESGSTDGYESGYAEGFPDGYESGSTDGYVTGFSEGHSSGVTDGIAEQKAKLESISIDADGFYTKEDGWSAVTVHVTKNYGTGSINMQAIEETYTKDSIRPMAPDGAAVYGGALSILEGLIDQYWEVRVYSWDNAQHTDRSEQGIFKNENGVYVWSQTQGGPIVTPLDNFTNSWTQADYSGHLFIMKDGANLYLYQTYGFGVMFGDPYGHVIPNEEMILPTEGYDAISALTVNAINVYNSGYTAGVADGFESGYTSGYTAGQKNPTLNYLWVRFGNIAHTWPSTAGISYIEFGDYYNHQYHGMFQFTIDSIEEEITADFDFEASGTCQYTDTINYVRLITSTEMKDAIGRIDTVSINGIEFKPNRWEGSNLGEGLSNIIIYFEPED